MRSIVKKKTVKAVLDGKADYVLSVKKNQRNLYDDIAEAIEFKRFDKVEMKESPLGKYSKTEKGHGRIEKRTAYVTHDVAWLLEREKWLGLRSIGAVVTEAETRYYISSHALSAEQLLCYTRAEWAVESMHWQLDVIFGEDRATLSEANAQKTLNILRKTVLNIVKAYRNQYAPKLNMVDILRKCSHDADFLLDVLRGFSDCCMNVTN
jgi:predicted transposase YbfD/YdcC